MSDKNFMLNCSVQRDYFLMNMTEQFNNSSRQSVESEYILALSGTFTGIVVALMFDALLDFENNNYSPECYIKQFTKLFDIKNLSRILVLTVLVLLLPFVTVFLFSALCFKLLCSVIIRNKDKHFVGFLDSFDVFWSLEEDSTKSIIDVLGVIESDSPQALAKTIKRKLQKIFPNEETEKIFYRRNEKFGFYYWRRYNDVDIDQYVQVVEFEDKSSDSGIADLEELLANIQDQSLPYNDKGLFKILVTNQRVSNHGKERGEYGIIFRFHHSIGDGFALIEFLYQTFADKTENFPVNLLSTPESCSNFASLKSIVSMMKRLCKIPLSVADSVLRKPDAHALHGPLLTGKKVFKWKQTDEDLLLMVKDIRNNIKEIHFTDVLLAALSNGLKQYFLETMAPVPEDVAVILPIRFPKSADHEFKLDNDFSVAILDVPVGCDDIIQETKSRCNYLRGSAQAQTNRYFLMLLTAVLPRKIIEPLLRSKLATLVLSNMPAPQRITMCGGNHLKALVFFVPLKGTTGLGVTALGYGDKLQLAASADVALVPTSDKLAQILDGMVAEICRLHRLHGYK